MARDLPAELWSEVISYLPRGHVRKLLGINRYLTEMALDEIYYSFALNNGFKRAVADIQRTRKPRYACRIKRLDIHSCFLTRSPEADGGFITCDLSRITSVSLRPKPAKESPQKSVKKSPLNIMKKGPLSTLGRTQFGTLIVSPHISSSSLLSGPVGLPVQPRVLAAIKATLSYWHQLEEISLFLHDYVSMPTFTDFLADLWSQKGESIRVLNIDATPSGLFNFLEIFNSRLAPLPNLERISMKFALLEDGLFPWGQGAMGHKLASFIRSHGHSLHTLIISRPLFIVYSDTTGLIRDLSYLPKLKKVELPVLMEPASYVRGVLESLETFLSINTRTLESLVMVYRPSMTNLALPQESYKGLLNNVLPKLHFPLLSELDMDVYVDSSARPTPFSLPPLRRFAPNLKKLNLGGEYGYLSDDEFTSLLENLSTGAVQLHSFNFQLEYLGPEKVDQLALNLPTLESLSITYRAISSRENSPFDCPSTLFYETFNREYVNWSLKYLRLAKASTCKGGHPDSRLSAKVGKSIPGLKVNDISSSCNCVS